jgi:hypothetical protein
MSQPQASLHLVSSSVLDLFNSVFHSVPKFLVFLFMLIMGWFVGTAAIVFVALGVIAALDQVGVASNVTQPIVYTVLLTCGAIIAIGVGGSLIKPMQTRWEHMLTAAERETAAYQRGHADAMRAVQVQGEQNQQHQQQEQQRVTQDPGRSQGPRYLQASGISRGPGYTQGFGFHLSGQGFPRDPGYQHASGASAETEIVDDPENYPGGQFM